MGHGKTISYYFSHIDLSVAFNTIDYDMVLNTRFVIDGNALEQHISYLSSRHPNFNIGQDYSTQRSYRLCFKGLL